MIFEIILFWIVVPVIEGILELLIVKPISRLLRLNKYTEKLLFNKTDGLFTTSMKSILFLFVFMCPIVLTLILIYTW